MEVNTHLICLHRSWTPPRSIFPSTYGRPHPWNHLSPIGAQTLEHQTDVAAHRLQAVYRDEQKSYCLAGHGLRRCVCKTTPRPVAAEEGEARNGDKGYHAEDAEECRECESSGLGYVFGVAQKVAHWV
jgi:hypothetical protein